VPFNVRGGRKGSAASPNLSRGAYLAPILSKLGNFTLAVQQEEIARGPRDHSPARGRQR
jgi:hypothetical protein